MKKIKILGYSYSLDLTDKFEDMKGNVGVCDLDHHIIKIANDLGEETRNSTLIHELIEAINYHLELSLKHNQIMGLEVGFHRIFDDNGISLNSLCESKKEYYDGDSRKPGRDVLLKAKSIN
jgi:hypothetical protein